MLTLRTAQLSDWARLLAWRNDPETRRAFVQTEPVTLSQHMQWLRETIAADDRALFIATDAQHGADVGTSRLDLRPTDLSGFRTCDISITVDPRHRRRGYAVKLINAAIAATPGEWGVRRVVASIRVENEASLRAFVACGFAVASKDHSFVTLEFML